MREQSAGNETPVVRDKELKQIWPPEELSAVRTANALVPAICPTIVWKIGDDFGEPMLGCPAERHVSRLAD
jgi:hypothetical protein